MHIAKSLFFKDVKNIKGMEGPKYILLKITLFLILKLEVQTTI